MASFLTKIFGSRNDRLIKQYRRKVEEINKLEPSIKALSDEELKAKTVEFRKRLADGETLDKLLPEAFAVVREASWRVLGMRHFDVQLIGGMVLNDGKIAEMRTGEGKTLTATLAVYLNALPGKGAHVVTVNDYLAKRDAEWMGKVYNFLGMSVGTILSNQPNAEKQAAYQADITYGTNNEYGFDYLRDNMEYDVNARRQRGLFFAIVDEVDSILIDEARTPLIISGPAEGKTDVYVQIDKIPDQLTRQKEEKGEGDYWVDEKAHTVQLSEAGHEKVEAIMSRMGLLPEGQSLYSPQNIMLLHYLNAALRAHTIFIKDQHYVVQNGEVIIVDEFTGRLMQGRRWSDGLHQAVEAKEGVKIQQENQTFASITFQNYFRMYEKLSGMTGTADTEAYEFQEIYGLETVVIPTHRQMIRDDQQDKVYRTAAEKYKAILDDVKDCYKRGQPVLVGTTSIENSELISHMLDKEGIPHNVLNAKQHEKEAQIVLEAGRPGMVTIATNMAGRGTDIVLGGGISKAVSEVENNPNLTADEKKAQIDAIKNQWQLDHEKVVALGGLRIIGSERHESRRIDNQLRGRSGRQGDPGSSRFYLSMEDPLLRIFAGEKMQALMNKLRLPEGEAIEAGIVSRSIESAQRKVESRNFDIRKQLLEYDDVANDQRREIYVLRNEILENKDVSGPVKELRDGFFTSLFRSYVPEDTVEEQWDLDGLEKVLKEEWNLDLPLKATLEKSESSDDQELLDMVIKASNEVYDGKVALVGKEAWQEFERNVLLQFLDQHWREHLSQLDMLRQGIHLRGYAQKQPKQEYKREAFELFSALLQTVGEDVTRVLMNVQIRQPTPEEQAQQQAMQAQEAHVDESEGQLKGPMFEQEAEEAEKFAHVGRNDPCPCGSGKKFKDCHGKLK
ncbi:preprotein translocase subunit SecA [Turicimonas muris]|uniref:Protein translocase subunit SecA n=6 Tax=Turicimonas muris TaxID=1796652 RepID=A0A227KII6_9BURK|nr:preprotein translocase subunit SecA [Turicimonas muris]ANU67047.1 preprotein translocase subunit SecA [Burkholderiales bacterium YL45]MBS4767394.1 preprotein translocase subunit SecA [Burkholderiales bacterium]OXE47675.1 preprotein translocase subunit SecA [Turicimonas muris]QQQ95900.1 preprotein translocase subunit SecA [Turicimonas muris]